MKQEHNKSTGPSITLLDISISINAISHRTTSLMKTSYQMFTVTQVLNQSGLWIFPFFLY